MILSQEYLKFRLRYDPLTGVFSPKNKMGRNKKYHDSSNFKKLGTYDISNGYYRISINGKSHRASRLAWLYMTGKWPTSILDHIDTDRGNNIFSNLREGTRKDNSRNANPWSTKNVPYKGVGIKHSRYSSRIRVDGKLINIGYFQSAVQAALAYDDAAIKYFKEFAFLNFPELKR